MRCPDENVLAGYVDGVLEPAQRRSLEKHLDECPACRGIVSDLARVASDPVDDTIKDPAPADAQWEPFGTTPSAVTIAEPKARAVELVPGTMVGEYEVTGVIGSGGMASVYSAVHPRIGKQAAIKVLQREHASDPAAIVRFENEAKAVNEIKHPNIVDIFAFGELADGNPYLVMERVDGENLQSWLDKRGRLSLVQAMPIVHQIVDALAAAHDRGIIHRDLKPSNIMISGSDEAPRVTILDFGLAKMTRAKDRSAPQVDADVELTVPGVALGTPLFMSPEQFLGEAVDLRTDVYALGVVIYLMLCGRYPFRGTTPQVIGMQHVVDPPPIPSSVAGALPVGIDEVLMKALAKEPAERHASVRELRDGLVSCIDLGIAHTLPPRRAEGAASPAPPASVPWPRSRIAIIVLAAAAAIAIAFVVQAAL